MREIRIYNSLTNDIEIFKPIKDGEITMYVCGPTVYNHIHIGNGRPIVFFDILKRFFTYLDNQVIMASNFTDIDDRIIAKAIESDKSEQDVSSYFIKAYLDICDKLNCQQDVLRPKVTEYMDQIIEFINQLIDKGFAYIAGDDVYFRVHKLKTYGILSNQKIDDLTIGARIDINSQKEDPEDFTLWKKTADKGQKWNSPFGMGRPGWHSECVVMIQNIFHSMIDIHGGGSDLKFPHHENEIAQSMALYNHNIANFWVHNGRINLKGEKMSKSVGNVIWLKDLLEEYNPNVYRLLIINNHYLQNISYTPELMEQMKTEYEKISRAYTSIYRYLELNGSLEYYKAPLSIMDDFLDAMANDFNTANAYTALLDLIKQINKELRNKNPDLNILQQLYVGFVDMLEILGLTVDVSPLNLEERQLVLDWLNARTNRNFALADQLREQIVNQGIKI